MNQKTTVSYFGWMEGWRDGREEVKQKSKNGLLKPRAVANLGVAGGGGQAPGWVAEREGGVRAPAGLLSPEWVRSCKRNYSAFYRIFVLTYVKRGDIISHWRRLII